MDARDVLLIGGAAALLFAATRRASASIPAAPYYGPVSNYSAEQIFAADIEDAGMFDASYPTYQETLTPITPEMIDTGGYDEYAASADVDALPSTQDWARAFAPDQLLPVAAGERNLDAFLRLLRRLEVGTDAPEGYARVHDAVARVMGSQYLTSLKDHPRVRAKFGGSTTSAAGGYQFQMGTWDNAARALGLPDFTPASQDAAATYLIKGRGALLDILAGKIKSAVAKLRNEWSSLPGAVEAQLDQSNFERMFLSYGGMIADGGAAYA